jgi:predicted Zn-dependent protease
LEPVAEFQRRAQLLADYSVSLYNIAFSDTLVGRFESALQRLDEMRAAQATLGVKGDSEYLARRSAARAPLGQLANAKSDTERAARIARTPRTRFVAQLQLADVLVLSGLARDSLELLDSISNDTPEEFEGQRRIIAARAALRTGDLVRAERELSAETTFSFAPHEREYIRVEQARLDSRRGRLNDARENLESALAWFEEFGFQYDATKVRIELARCLVDLGLDVPRDLLRSARAYIESQPFCDNAPIGVELGRVNALINERNQSVK